jgi:hypothetical protein
VMLKRPGPGTACQHEANSKAQNLARAAMEAAIFCMRVGLDSFKAPGYQTQEIRLIGCQY